MMSEDDWVVLDSSGEQLLQTGGQPSDTPRSPQNQHATAEINNIDERIHAKLVALSVDENTTLFQPPQPGSVIALHSPAHNRFVRMMIDSEVNAHDGPMDFDNLPLYGPKRWDSELFIVVDAGDGEIALQSPSHGRFMQMDSCGSVNALGWPKLGKLETAFAQRFTIVDAGNGLIALHSKSQNRFVTMDTWGGMNSLGGFRDVDMLPDAWEWERFRARILTQTEVISLHENICPLAAVLANDTRAVTSSDDRNDVEMTKEEGWPRKHDAAEGYYMSQYDLND
mmetsp:Transcript_1918/g.3290  ORF Transcript_1918/g.3290 Transcript_1918/m.3290 type:complete len:282 (+) Transcript_1918:84-929(+)